MVLKLRRIRWAGHIARMGDENYLQYFNLKPERKIPIGRHRRR
jgi:hypothetical protein